DWSSDVCSSDLGCLRGRGPRGSRRRSGKSWLVCRHAGIFWFHVSRPAQLTTRDATSRLARWHGSPQQNEVQLIRDGKRRTRRHAVIATKSVGLVSQVRE